MAEISGFLRRAFRIDQHRQIPAQSHRIHVVEEKCAVAAKQILHIVLGGGDEDIDAGHVHEAIEAIRVERNRCPGLPRHVEHDEPPDCVTNAHFPRHPEVLGATRRASKDERTQSGPASTDLVLPQIGS
jgi:hypothetical protein